MAERCPYCGLTVVGAVAVHIAYTQGCQHEQLIDVLFDQPLITEDES